MALAHVRTTHGIEILKPTHPVIRSLNKRGPGPSLHGTRIWRSTFMLIEYLEGHPPQRDRRIMEIGCGWGLLGIYCAKQFPVEVLLTDADAEVFPYVTAHARLNGVSVKTEQARFDGIKDRRLASHDLLLGGDICFWPELGTQLRRLIERGLSLGVTKVILADPGRRSFMRLATYCQRRLAATLIPWQMSNRNKSGGYLLIVENPP
jgi:predicted nicotinamide N-methyase